MSTTAVGPVFVLFLIMSLSAAHGAESSASNREVARYRQWVMQMKDADRGPFARIRWFCADGAVLAPASFACKNHGGGVQHGEHSARTREIRAAGYPIANVLANIDSKAFLAANEHRETLAQMLIEQFLFQIDDGWILRRARYYRGAFQEEDERRAGRELLLALVASNHHLQRDYVLLRSAVRVLPHGVRNRSASIVRQLSADLSDRDKSFLALRNKIHGSPEASDAQRVRDFATARNNADSMMAYENLARAIDELYSGSASDDRLRELEKRTTKSTAIHSLASAARARLRNANKPVARMTELSNLLAALRDSLLNIDNATIRLLVFDVSLALESDLYVATSTLIQDLATADRRTRSQWLEAAVQATYGAGLVSQRQRAALLDSAAGLQASTIALASYKRELDYLALLPGWSAQRLHFHFGSAIARFTQLEPKAIRFVEDKLRGSPLFFYAQVLDTVLRDANRLAGVQNELFAQDVGAGLRALNPGLARGRLSPAPSDGNFTADGIYVLPETTSDLPPVAGILTAGAGNPLSHVQLLARNLGIPNVGIDQNLLPSLEPLYGKTVILAVSAAGSVRLTEDKGEGEQLFSKKARAEDQVVIRPNLDKLDLSER